MVAVPDTIRSTIVIPCYNEAQRLDVATIASFLRSNPTVRLLFVDDGSTDGTNHVLDGIRQSMPTNVEVVTLSRNQGKAGAVRCGVLRALSEGCEFVGYWDADLATPLDDVLTFERILNDRPDLWVVFGSRVQLLGRHIERRMSRHYSGRVFASVVSMMLRLRVYDTQCGAKLFRVRPLVRSLFEEPFGSRWVFDVELIARLIVLAREQCLAPVEDLIYEHPLMSWHDVPGSKVDLWSYARSFIDVIRIQRRYFRRRVF